MADDSDEEKLLRSVALQNAHSILAARQRADEELIRAKEALERRTQELARSVAMTRATLESTTDGILVTDGAGQVTDFNEKFVAMWRLSRAAVDGRAHRQVLETIGPLCHEPAHFLARVAAIDAASPPETYDLLDLADGRTIERFSCVQVVDGRNVGRVWSFRDVTERRCAETALQKQWEWFRVTLASIGDAVLATDINGKVTFLNPVAEALTGWDQERALGAPLDRIFRVINERSRQAVENPISKVLRDGQAVGLANHSALVARDGSERPIDDSGAPIRDERGAIIGAVLVFRDVTERRRADEARLHLAAIVESSDDAIIGKDLNGVIRSWNRGAEQLYGYTAAEVIGRPITLLIPADRPHEEDEILARLRRGECVDHLETVRVRKDGARLDVSVTSSPIRDSDGHITGASKIARDITDRKRAEKTIRSLARISEKLNSTLDVNELLHLLMEEVIALVDAEGGLAGLCTDDGMVSRKYFREGQAVPFDYCWPAQEGLPGWLLIHKVPYLTNNAAADPQIKPELRERFSLRSVLSIPILGAGAGAVLGFFQVHNKRDPRGFSEADLRQLLSVAQSASVAIQNALAYQKVRHTEAALRDSDRRKDEFLATLAHELRNPLAPIRNALQIMKMAAGNREALQSAQEMMGRQVQHMVRLIDDLLDLSRISQGKIQLRKELVELGTVLHSAIETARPLIQAAGHELSVQLPPTRMWLDADPTRLAQVIGNLLNNAAKYTKEGGHIALIAEHDGSQAVLRVRDDGIGIPADMLPRIFDMFAQVDTAIGRSQGGLGIGLTLVRSLVDMHGGTVQAASDGPGKGSEFVVRLPVATERLGIQAAARRPTETERPEKARRILVVDDNVDGAQSLSAMLKLMGHDTALAHDGISALETAYSYRPDMVLLDIGLPRLNGYEVARRLRQEPQLRDVVLVAVTGWGQEEDRRRSREAGFDHHLTKPPDPAAIAQLLASLRPSRA
jgi:PAS domain S-box-containing protein